MAQVIRLMAALLALTAAGAAAADDACATARTHMQAWDLDAASKAYPACVAAEPAALLEFAEVETYRGDRRHARRLLERYRRQAGDTAAYRKAEAAFLARGGRPRAALRALEPQLQQRPDDYDLNLTRTLALNESRETAQARQSLATLDRLGPARPETRGARLQVETPLRPRASLGSEFYTDTSGISILHSWFETKASSNGGFDVLLQGHQRELGADRDSGYETPAGDRVTHERDLAVAVRMRPAGSVQLELAGGRIHLDSQETFPLYRGRLDHWAGDTFHWSVSGTHDLLAISPRAAALGIERNEYVAAADWSPGTVTVVEARFATEEYSDRNSRWEAVLAPRRAMMRTQHHNFDLGLYGQWLGYDQNLNNGYYDPSGFERYWAMGYYYWKASDNAGVGLVAGGGPEKDADLDDGFRLGGNVYLGGTWGVYRDWQIRGWGGYGSRIGAGDYDSGRPHGYSVGLELTRRF